MRYDIDSDKIIISCREFVTMARRGIAASMPADSDEPELHTASKRILKKIMGDTSPEYISYSFDKDEFSFLLSARAEKADGCNLWFTTEVDSNPSRPKKECTTQLRGEGFVFAYVYAKQKGLYRVKLNFVFINSETDSHF